MTLNSVERDLATMLFTSASNEYLREKLTSIFGKEDFYETMKQYKISLTEIKEEFENAWQILAEALQKNGFNKDDILSQLQNNVFSQNGTEVERH